MTKADFARLVGPALASALEQRGFTSLTPVQTAVLKPELAGRDLRISSQTGSGKTVAIGFVLRDLVAEAPIGEGGVARPRALVVVPTRELAKQVDEELSWLYAPLRARVASATGGASYRDERRAFAAGPAVVVGTPGRLLDHLNRGSIDPSALGAVVLDEADRMLDLGFREDLEAILAHAPPDHLTHLVSATFAREVLALANRVQNDPARIEATPMGTANADIDHVVHLVAPHDRVSAIVNLLLSTPGAQTLVFARTRADVARIAGELGEAGFDVRALSGEMEQVERTRALAAFRKGSLQALVATDVAARGIDVQDIARVVHAEPPTDPDSYTHRSGRTGRAGKKGTSAVLVSPAGLARTSQLLKRTGVRFRIEPIPAAEDIRRANDERLFAELTAEGAPDDVDPRLTAIAGRAVAAGEAVKTIARLLARSRQQSSPQPREIAPLVPPDRPSRSRLRAPEGAPAGARGRPSDTGRERGRHTAHEARAPERVREHPRGHEPRREHDPERQREYVPFRFTWGREHGADPRRLLAMACRRGGIHAQDIGAIDVARTHSVVQVASTVASEFEERASAPDPRDPRVAIRREHGPNAAVRSDPRARERPPPPKKRR